MYDIHYVKISFINLRIEKTMLEEVKRAGDIALSKKV